MTDYRNIVFLGPSLSHAEAAEILPDALYLPPAAMGDVFGAVTRFRPHAIGLVDGTFLSNMSVFHKEILFAMEHGVWMLGASSMGALRAAECDDFGMIGVGSIYEALVSGAIEDDDEVALTHADAAHEFRPLTDAMVTIRATIEGARAAELVDADEAAALIAMQKGRWFPERRLSSVFADARSLGIDERRSELLRTFVSSNVIDPKRADAVALLQRMADLPTTPIPDQDRPVTVRSGVFKATLARDLIVEDPGALPITFDRIRKYAALHDAGFQSDMRRAKAEVALATLAEWLAGPPTEAEMTTARRRLCDRVHVEDHDLESWAASVDLYPDALKGLLAMQALLHRMETSWLGRSRMGEITGSYLNLLRLEGRYASVKSAAALSRAASKGIVLEPQPSPNRVVASIATMCAWTYPEDLTEYLDEMEFSSTNEFVHLAEESVRAHLALFGVGLVDMDGEDDIQIVEDDEPMMSRGR